MPFYLAPWELDTTEDAAGVWRPPYTNVAGVIDLRSDAQIRGDGVAEGYGLFATRTAQTVSDAISLGDNLDGSVAQTTVQQALGLGEKLVATDLRTAIFELLVHHADPAVSARWGTLMPNRNRQMEIHLGGRITSVALPASGPVFDQVVKREAENYKAIKALVDAGVYASDRHRKVLGAWQRKYGVSDHEIFIPAGYVKETPLPPETTVSDDFNRSDENLEASANWALLQSASGTESLAVVSNRVRDDVANATESPAWWQSDLSSDDHYAQGAVPAFAAPSSTRNYASALCRVSSNSGAANDYHYQVTIDSSSVVMGRLGKYTGTSPTRTEFSDESEAFSASDVVRCEADGSTIRGKINGSETTSTTDTSFTGQLRPGIAIRVRNGVAADIEMDDFEGADLVAGGNAMPMAMNTYRQMRL